MLDDMHFRKIDLADEIFVINVGGYIGSSTQAEIAYATKTGKPVHYLEVHGMKQFENQITDPQNNALDQIKKALDHYGFLSEIRFDRKDGPYINLGDVRRRRLRNQFWYDEGRIDFYAGKETGYWYSSALSSPYNVPWDVLSDVECRVLFPDLSTAIQFIQDIAAIRGRR